MNRSRLTPLTSKQIYQRSVFSRHTLFSAKQPPSPVTTPSESPVTTPSESSPTTPTSPSKNVSFSREIKVVLIPCIAEYKDAGCHTEIWSANAEIKRYATDAKTKLGDLLSTGMSLEEAKQELFYPQDETDQATLHM